MGTKNSLGEFFFLSCGGKHWRQSHLAPAVFRKQFCADSTLVVVRILYYYNYRNGEHTYKAMEKKEV